MAPATRNNGFEPSRSPRKPESVEVTTPRLYVGNLSFDATESDLFELFNGVGAVQNAEVVTYKHNQRSKGFAFVQMLTVDEAKRAVEELHDKEFLGRKLVVSGAKSSEHHSAELTICRLAKPGDEVALAASLPVFCFECGRRLCAATSRGAKAPPTLRSIR